MGDRERHVALVEDRLERSTLLRLEAALARRSPGFVIVVGLLVLALIGLVDALTGGFSVSVIYLLPVGVVTFARGRWVGALMAGIAAVAWSAAEVVNRLAELDSPVPYVNALTRFYAFIAVCLLIGPMRDALMLQRELARKEAEAAERLRALNELRDALSHDDLVLGETAPADQMHALSELRDSLRRLDEIAPDHASA